MILTMKQYPNSLILTTMFLHFATVNGQYHIPSFRPINGNPIYMGVAISVTAIFVAIIFLVLHFYCKPQARPRVRIDDGLAHPACIGLDPSVLETFPHFKYSELAGQRNDTGPLECSVCLCPFEADEMLRLLPKCNHTFHVSCLDPWLKDHVTCPLCRVYVVPESGELNLVDAGRVDGSGNGVQGTG